MVNVLRLDILNHFTWGLGTLIDLVVCESLGTNLSKVLGNSYLWSSISRSRSCTNDAV